MSSDQSAGSDVVLQLSGVGKQFGSFCAVERVDLSVRKNQLVTLLGPSGCGKTTTLRMIAGFEYPTSGSIRIGGEDVTNVPPNRRQLGMVFQSYSLFPHMRVADNVAYGLKRRGVPKEERVQRVREALEMVDLLQFADRSPKELSGGQQQRVALARAIVIRPRILLLDEPLSALDAKLRQRMRYEIRELQRKIGMTTVMVTHDQEEALSMSDHVVVMNKGLVEQEGDPRKIYARPSTPFVAHFIGETNLFSGELSSGPTEGEHRKFTADCGLEMLVPAGHVSAAGSRAQVSLRPEALNISGKVGLPTAGQNSAIGQVSGVSYLGARTVLQIRTATCQLMVSVPSDFSDDGQPAELFSEGQDVSVSWSPAAARLLEARP
jgi:spermidine/putrescine ABC transporter ATP-binding subunit